MICLLLNNLIFAHRLYTNFSILARGTLAFRVENFHTFVGENKLRKSKLFLIVLTNWDNPLNRIDLLPSLRCKKESDFRIVWTKNKCWRNTCYYYYYFFFCLLIDRVNILTRYQIVLEIILFNLVLQWDLISVCYSMKIRFQNLHFHTIEIYVH